MSTWAAQSRSRASRKEKTCNNSCRPSCSSISSAAPAPPRLRRASAPQAKLLPARRTSAPQASKPRPTLRTSAPQVNPHLAQRASAPQAKPAQPATFRPGSTNPRPARRASAPLAELKPHAIAQQPGFSGAFGLLLTLPLDLAFVLTLVLTLAHPLILTFTVALILFLTLAPPVPLRWCWLAP